LGDPEVDVIARLGKDDRVEHESEVKVASEEARIASHEDEGQQALGLAGSKPNNYDHTKERR
jgi:hypothetical protein